MKRLIKHTAFLIALAVVGVCSSVSVLAQNPNFKKFDSLTPDGRYVTNDVIELEAQFDDWLGLNSTVDVLLNTGDVVTLTFNPSKATDLLDATWGVPDASNTTDYGGSYYGVACILELEGKGGYTENKGRMVIAGGFQNYEGTVNDDFVITDNDGKTVIHTYGNRSNDGINEQVRWVIETQDGGLLIGGRFTNFGGTDVNPNYDYLVKLKGDFSIDQKFMENLCSSGGGLAPALNGEVAPQADTYGKPGYCMAEDADGSIYVMGSFSSVGGVTRRGVVKLKADGTVDQAFNANYTQGTNLGRGSSVAIDGDYIWVGCSGTSHWQKEGEDNVNYRPLDRLNKYTGDRDPGYTPLRFGIIYGILGIQVMPEPAEGGPGGVLVTGKYHYGVYENGTSANNEEHIVSVQDDGSVTPRGTGPGYFDAGGMFNQNWAVDGFAILKNKIWIGVHESFNIADRTEDANGVAHRFFTGSLAVLNLDGSGAYEFNNMFRHDKTVYSQYSGFHGFPHDILSVYVDSQDRLLVGGNYDEFMERSASATGDDDGLTRLTFNRATGTYQVSADDMVGQLEIVAILNHDVSGAFGDPSGTVDMGNIIEGDGFELNHHISINMPISTESDQFLSTWRTTTADEIITLPLVASNTYDFYVDWGDGRTINTVHYANLPNMEAYSGLGSALTVSHQYATPGDYQIKIYAGGKDANDYSNGLGFPAIDFSTSADKAKLLSIDQWGNIQWKSMNKAFMNCANMTMKATDAPNLAGATDLTSMFEGCTSLTGTQLNANWAWTVSTITNFSRLFAGASAFDGNISGWTTTAATNMTSTFEGASLFNQDISTWNVSKVTSFVSMFKGAAKFNQNIGRWTLKQTGLITMNSLFEGATDFDQNLSAWKIKALNNAENMFSGAKLSQENYDALLYSWFEQVDAGNASQTVKFHGGASTYCMAEAARQKLIDYGWGDGVTGDASTAYTDIVDGGLGCQYNPFVMEWEVLESNKEMTIPTQSTQSGYNFMVSWGDGYVDSFADGVAFQHTYKTAGTYEVKIVPMLDSDNNGVRETGFPSINFSTELKRNQLKKITAWGDGQWATMNHAFANCDELQVTATDAPDLSICADLSNMFASADKVNFDVSGWDVSNITTMEQMFYQAKAFNNGAATNEGGKPITWGEKTAKVTTMKEMFNDAEAFNQSVSGWDVSALTTTQSMFAEAVLFNNGEVGNTASKPLGWLVPTTAVLTDVSYMFGAKQLSAEPVSMAFNQEVSCLKTDKVTDYSYMFINAKLFDQDISSFKIASVQSRPSGSIAPNGAYHMLDNTALSVANYDNLLISWAAQVEALAAASTPKTNVFFHAVGVQYCAGEAKRKYLIDQGWGDGVLGASSGVYDDITDGGSLAPDVSGVGVEAPSIFQTDDAIIKLSDTDANVTYYALAEDDPTGTPVSLEGAVHVIALNMGAITANTSYRVWANGGNDCDAELGTYEIKVYQRPNLATSTVTVTTAADFKAANGTDAHTVEVKVLDMLGAVIVGAEVRFAPTANTTFTPDNSTWATTNASGVASYSITSTKAADYSTRFSAHNTNPEDNADVAGGDIQHVSNPAKYTFGADVPDMTDGKSSVVKLTQDTVAADGAKTHRFLVKLIDANDNPVSGVSVKFAATENVTFHYYTKNETDSTKVSGTANTALVAPTRADGTLRVYATSTKAWTEFSTAVSHDYDGNGTYESITGSPMKYTYVNGLVSSQTSTITATPDEQAAGSAIELKITLLDEYNNAVRGQKVVFKQAKLESNSSLTTLVIYDASGYADVQKITDNNGVATVSAVSTTAGKYKTQGTVIVKQTDGTETEAQNGPSVGYTFTASTPDGGNDGNSLATLKSNNAESDGVATNQIQAIIRDEYNNLVKDAKVKIEATADIDWGSGYSADQVVTTDASGMVNFYGKSITPGSYTTKVQVETSTGVWATIKPEAGLTHEFVNRSMDFDNSVVTITESPAVADSVDFVQGHIQLNNAEGYPISVGDHYVIIYATADVGMAINSYSVGNGDEITKLANGNWIVKVTAGAAWFAIYSKVAGTYSTDFGMWDNDTQSALGLFQSNVEYSFVPGPASAANSFVRVSDPSKTVGEDNTISVELHDQYDNVISQAEAGTAVKFAATTDVSIGGGAESVEYTHALNAGDNGTFGVLVTSNSVGNYQTAVTLAGDALQGSPAEYNFVAAAPDMAKSYYEVIQTQGHIDGTAKVKIRATLKDEHGNPVAGVNVRFKNDYVAEGCLDFGVSESADGRKATNAEGVSEVTISSIQYGRFNSTVAFSTLADWENEAGFTGNELPHRLGGPVEDAPFYFVDDYTTVDVLNNIAIRAKWYVVQQADADGYGSARARTDAELKVWYLNGSTDYINKDQMNVIGLAEVQNSTDAVGPYDMEFKHRTIGSSRTVTASVVDTLTKWDPQKELAIYAESYHLTVAQAMSHTMDDAIGADCGHAKAWRLSDGEILTNTTNITPGNSIFTDLHAGVTGNHLMLFRLTDLVVEPVTRITADRLVTVIADNEWFITTWQVAAGETITIPTNPLTSGYDFVVDWGDDNHPESFVDGDAVSHTYTTADTCTIKIAGKFPQLFFNDGDAGQQKNKILTVEQWGTIEWKAMNDAFEGCVNLQINATDTPDLRQVTNMEDMFKGAAKMNSANLQTWNVSTVTSMAGMFNGAKLFNQSLSSWNTAAVTSMAGMFQGASKFDQSLASWDISSLTNAENMLRNAKLSLANYDATLISWWGQVKAGTAKPLVKFHGGASQYCTAKTEREQLINNGWGDGFVFGDYGSADSTGILDGGSALPSLTLCFQATTINLCENETVTLTLQESEVGVEYQLYEVVDGVPTTAIGDWMEGTGSTLSFPPFTQSVGTKIYGVDMRVKGYATCSAFAACRTTVNVAPPTVAGTVAVQAGSNSTICYGGSTVLELTGHTGEVIRWEYSVGGTFTNPQPISNITNTLTVSGIHASRSYRAVVQSGACEVAYSTDVRITVDALSVGGTVSPAVQAINAGATADLTLAGHTGDVIRWESSANSDFSSVTAITNTTTSLTTEALMADTYYRAVVQNGMCDEVYSAAALVKVTQLDYGDAPTSYGAAYHAVVPGEEKIYLGTMKPDTETTQPYSEDAKGDDDNAIENDEDALATLNYTTDGSKITISGIEVKNTSGALAYMMLWLDGNQDGVFSDDERITLTNLVNSINAVPAGGKTFPSMSTKDYNYQLKPGYYFVRIRVGSQANQVVSPTGFAQDGEVEDYRICVRPNELKPDDVNVKICASTETINLNNTLYYAGTADWSDSNGAILNPAAYSVSDMAAGDMRVVSYKVTETFCENMTSEGSAKVYIKAFEELNIADKTVKVCVDDAESLNLSSLLGIAESGTWTADDTANSIYLSNGRFDGKSAYGTAETDQTYVFTFTPETGSCITTIPKLTIVITKEL